MGLIWSFVTPLLMLFIYTFVFKYVFKARWGVAGEVQLNFAMVLFLGLTIHAILSDIISRSPGLILSNVNFVKKVVFPLEILPWVAFLSALFNFAIGFLLLFCFILIELHSIPVAALYLPLILLPYFVLVLGLSWILAALGVYVRDIQHISGTLATLLLFMSPVFYSIDNLPETFQSWILLNPIALIVEECRTVLFYNEAPDFKALAIYSCVALLVVVLGFWMFQKSRKGFADVL